MPRPHFTPGKDPVPILQEAGWAPGPVWTGGKSRPHRDSFPDRPAHSQSLYRLSYPAHLYYTYFVYFQFNSLDMNLRYKVGVRAGCKKQKIMRPVTYSVDPPPPNNNIFHMHHGSAFRGETYCRTTTKLVL